MGNRSKTQMLLELGSGHSAFEREVRNFIKRNIIIESTMICNEGRFSSQIPCCPQCLKAHMLKKAKKFGLDEEKIYLLEQCLKCEEGHNGYYLDVNKMLKCRA
ncbi:MAG: hypothetical protein QXD13_00145 [Candidatus Pacearchaeota archaeon]